MLNRWEKAARNERFEWLLKKLRRVLDELKKIAAKAPRPLSD